MAVQPHTCLSRRAATLPPVARNTAGDDVLPVLAPALRHRHHMVEGQLRRGERVVAVLAGVIVARVDVRPGEGDVIEPAFYLHEAKQANDRRQLEGEGHCPYLAVMN